jgi:hypothetical protein
MFKRTTRVVVDLSDEMKEKLTHLDDDLRTVSLMLQEIVDDQKALMAQLGLEVEEVAVEAASENSVTGSATPRARAAYGWSGR